MRKIKKQYLEKWMGAPETIKDFFGDWQKTGNIRRLETGMLQIMYVRNSWFPWAESEKWEDFGLVK